MLSGNGLKTQQRSYDELYDPRRLTMFSETGPWFNQPHLAGVRLIGLWGWVRLHTCCALSNQWNHHTMMICVLCPATVFMVFVWLCFAQWFDLYLCKDVVI